MLTHAATETQDNERVFGPFKSRKGLQAALTSYTPHCTGWKLQFSPSFSFPFIHLSLSCVLILSLILHFSPHSFSTARLPPFLPLSLSYSTNCCWSSVFCAAREIFQCALQWTMACLSSEQRRLGDTPWITLTFQQIARMPPSPVKCFGIWSLPWPDTLCLLMYSGLPWLMPQCSMSQLAAEALKIFLLYRLFLQHWPVPSQETEREAGQQQKKNRRQGYCPVSGWPATAIDCVVPLLLSDPEPSRYPHSCSEHGRECVWTWRPASVSALSNPNDAPLK